MRRTRPLTLAAIFTVSVAVAWLVSGGVALAFLLPVWLLFLAWRFDNHTGSLLFLAVMFLVVVFVMVLLIGLMALGHRQA